MKTSGFYNLALGSTLFLLLIGASAAAAAGQVELVSHVDPAAASDTASGGGPVSFIRPAVSRNGRYVAFLSVANNLVPGQADRNADGGQESYDVFLYDRVGRTTVLVSHDAASPATGGNGESEAPAISADGRWVVFPSASTNLVDGLPENAKGQFRLFLYDRVTEALTLVSSSDFLETNGGSGGGVGAASPAISADGRFLAYVSNAPDLVPGQQDGNQSYDIFLYDRTARTTSLVSHAGTPASTEAGSTSRYFSMSADGRSIAFNRLNAPEGSLGDGEVLLYDRLSTAVTPIAPGGVPTISADGGSIAFLSSSRQVIPGQIDANGDALDVFLYSRAAGRIVLVSHAAGKPTTTGNAPSDIPSASPPLVPLISADGRSVVFFSHATNLVQRQITPGGALFLYDRTTGTVTLASRKGSSPTTSAIGIQSATLSADGRSLAFGTLAADQIPNQIDLNNGSDVFLFDARTGTTSLVSARAGSSHGGRNAGNHPSYLPAISADGSQIALYSNATDLVTGVRDLNSGEDLFLYSVAARTSTVVTLHPPGMASVSPAADSILRGLSTDGRWVLFEGGAVNLVPGQVDANGQSDVFLYDHVAHKPLLVSHASAATAMPATAANGPSYQSVASADGRYVAFTSYATNLDPTVTDYIAPTGQRRFDVFLFDRVTGKNLALSRSARHPGFTADADSQLPAISADGRWVAFTSQASDLTTTAGGNVYLYDRVAGVLTHTSASVTTAFNPRPLALSADGRYLVTLERVGGYNVFLYDRATGTNTLVSHDRTGAPAGVQQTEVPALSADGRFVAFTSGRSDLGSEPGGGANVYLWDREGSGVTLLGVSDINPRTFPLFAPALSADGRWIAFLSNAETPVPGFDNPAHNFQAVLHDRLTGTSTLVTASAAVAGQASQGTTTHLAITPDGRWIAFDGATDVLPGVAGDLQGGIFLYDRTSGTVSTVALASPTFGSVLLPSADGRAVAFESAAPNLVPHDFNGVRSDVFLFTQTP